MLRLISYVPLVLLILLARPQPSLRAPRAAPMSNTNWLQGFETTGQGGVEVPMST